jgi:hypothetical protein
MTSRYTITEKTCFTPHTTNNTRTHILTTKNSTYITSPPCPPPLNNTPSPCPYQAFREITNFIRDNGDDWDKFCNTATQPSTVRKAVKPPPLSKKVSPHKKAEARGHLLPEPLLQENPHRFVLFPIKHNDIWRMYKKAEASFWTTEEIDLMADTVDWERLTSTKQHFISHVLAFFAASDGIINENLSGNFATEITSPEA